MTTDAAPASKLRYMSDCSVTHPVARDPCSAPPATSGVASCSSLKVTADQACSSGAPRCFVERTCDDGRVVAADFLVCVEEQPGRCFTKSSRRFKRDIEYLGADEIDELARRVEALRLARYRYRDADEQRLGFITEDAPGAPFVSTDGTQVDLYALLAATIGTLQVQERRIRELEQRCH